MTWTICPSCNGASVARELNLIEDVNKRCSCDNTGLTDSYTGRHPERRHDVDASLIRAIQERVNK